MFVNLSLFTSILFFFTGLYFYGNKRFPVLICVSLMACGIASTFHHSRRYDEPGWEMNEIRALDFIFAAILGGLLIYYYGRHLLLWIMGVVLIGCRIVIDCLNTSQEKTIGHAVMHLILLAGIIELCWTNKHKHKKIIY